MFKILTLNKISKSGLVHLPTQYYEILDNCNEPDGILVRSADMHNMSLSDSTQAIARAGAGVNNIPIPNCTEKGIVVFNTPGANANAVKELVISALLLSSRKIYQGINWCQSLKNNENVKDVPKEVEKGKAAFAGCEIYGKKLGVIGLGAIGLLVANVGLALGMEVIGYDPFIYPEGNFAKVSEPKDIYEKCDYICLHVPLNQETKNMLNSATIGLMKDGVKIINLSRGDLVDNSAIIHAVKTGKVSCYVTDFPNGELLGYDNIITIPHLGASTPESEENCAAMAAVQLKDFLEFGNIKNSVNFPDCYLPHSGNQRLIILYKDKSAALDKINNILNHVVITNKTIASNGEHASAIFEFKSDNEKQILNDLKQIPEVLSVRIKGN